MWAKSTGPYKAGAVAAGQSAVSLMNPSMVSPNSLSGKQINEVRSVSGEAGSGFRGFVARRGRGSCLLRQ